MKMDFWTLVHPFFSRNFAIDVLTLLLVMSYMMKHIIYPGFLSAEEMMFSICLILSGRVGSSSKFPVTLPMVPVPDKPGLTNQSGFDEMVSFHEVYLSVCM